LVTHRWNYYGKGLPTLADERWPGHFVVIEGADGCGRSTQIALLKNWLEQEGHAVLDTGLQRSNLVSKMITRAKAGNVLGRTTLSLLYATDLADQLENSMIPALRAGFIVLADRYVFSLIARDMIRGAQRNWLEHLFGYALKPNLTVYLRTTPEERLHRALAKSQTLDYWESGMDLGLAADRYTSFIKYQELLQNHLESMADRYRFITVDGSVAVDTVHLQVRKQVEHILERSGIRVHA
jgi:dTMP kinase